MLPPPFHVPRNDRLNGSDSSADEHLLRLIREQDQDGWAQFVQRYQGRMIAFARAQMNQSSDAEDLVQEAFIGFLRSLETYREESNLESWLFRILRRRIIDHFRAKGSNKEITACSFTGDSNPSPSDPIAMVRDPQESPSVHARLDEAQQDNDRTLSRALHTVIDRIKRESNLRDLMIMEGLFYAAIRNRDLGQLIHVDEGQIALVRHRLLKRLRDLIDQDVEHEKGSSLQTSDLLTRIWERDRPSCPKRTTLGKSLIGILDDPWQDYIAFHVDILGCRYCQANRDDLSQDELADDVADRGDRIFQSTIGFVSRPQ